MLEEIRSHEFYRNFPSALNYANSLLSFKLKHNVVLLASSNFNFVVLRMRCEVFNYDWYMNSFTNYLTIVIVILYMIVAITYTSWVLITSVMSSSWDIMTKLLTLTLQSSISEALSDSEAEVKKLKTYKCLIRLRARTKKKEAQDYTKKRLILIVDSEEIFERKKKELNNIRNESMIVDEKYL